MSANHLVPPLLPRGSFTGVPAHFRGWCMTASQGGAVGGYHWVGRQFGAGLLEYVPRDLEHDEWLNVVGQMLRQCLEVPSVDRKAIDLWLRRHFPFMMRLVPRKRFESFIDGFMESFEEGEMTADLPLDFEPVAISLDDPCGGEGHIWVLYHRPFPRQVLYQCPAARCRDASRVAVEELAKKHGLPLVDLGETIAAVRDLSNLGK